MADAAPDRRRGRQSGAWDGVISRPPDTGNCTERRRLRGRGKLARKTGSGQRDSEKFPEKGPKIEI